MNERVFINLTLLLSRLFSSPLSSSSLPSPLFDYLASWKVPCYRKVICYYNIDMSNEGSSSPPFTRLIYIYVRRHFPTVKSITALARESENRGLPSDVCA